MADNGDQIIAVISPRSVGGTSLFEHAPAITSETVHGFHSSASHTNGTVAELERLGFKILSVGPITISFSGTPKQFQSAFGIKPQKQKLKVDAHQAHRLDYFAASTEDAAKLMQPPQALAGIAEGIAIAQPPQLFESPLPPLASTTGFYRYLTVPEEVAVVIRAARVHRLGVTGRNVVVAMIDSGHYKHPFFNWHGYRVLSVLLGSGAADPAKDDLGHGTGESANIFAAAPDIQLRPIKGLNDPTGDFNVATASTPKPQVMTNSWGYDVDYQSWAQLQASDLNLYNYLKTLEAAVANAVAGGIVVCFSGGNGQRSFPGSHPDVIAVGGVHVNYPDLSLEASSYASSFDSQLYPGRHVPDLCGLTGKRVTIQNQGRAPSHMLPVQPGCTLDGISPTTGAPDDGWGLFSGTSAASPLVAGVCALLLEKNPALTPAQVKDKLIKSARDVKIGTTASGDTAGPGADAATGAGLVDAKWAYLVAMGDIAAEFMAAPRERQAAMLAAGQMPQLPREFVADLIETLRST